MSVRFLLIFILAMLPLAGCHRDPQLQVYIDNMNAEKRVLEDSLYELQYDYEAKLEELRKVQGELDALKGTGGLDRNTDSVLSPNGRSSRGPHDLSPPAVDQGTPSGTDEKPADTNGFEDLEAPQLELGQESEDLGAVPMPLDQEITHLYLKPVPTGGDQPDDPSGSDRITVVFEPRNKNNEYVPIAGRVTCALLDPEKRTRMARREFKVSETQAALRKRGIQLTMPLQEAPAKSGRAHLFVRYWAPDGRTVEADREITIATPEKLATRWTPRSIQRPPLTKQRVADNPATPSTDAEDPHGTDPRQNPTSGAPKQAKRPEWKPYR